MPAEGDASHRKQRAAHSSCPAWQPFPLSPAPWFQVRPSTDCRLQPHSQRHAWCRGRAGCTCANGEPPIEVRQRERLWTVASILVAEKRIESHVLGGLEHLSAGLHHEVGAPAKGKGQHLPNIEGLARLRVMKGHMHVMTCGIAIAGQLVDDMQSWADQWPRQLGPGTPARGVPAQAAGGQGARHLTPHIPCLRTAAARYTTLSPRSRAKSPGRRGGAPAKRTAGRPFVTAVTGVSGCQTCRCAVTFFCERPKKQDAAERLAAGGQMPTGTHTQHTRVHVRVAPLHAQCICRSTPSHALSCSRCHR